MKMITASLVILTLGACQNNTEPAQPAFEVVYVDISQSCGWNLKIANGLEIYDYNENRKDSFLHSNIEDFNTDSHLLFGDTVMIDFKVLPIVPEDYPMAEWQCNRFEGIPVQILKLSE